MSHDALDQEMEYLAFTWPAPNRTLRGVRLTAEEYSRYKELRGQVVTHPDSGLTMEEHFRAMIAMPEYQALTRAARIEVWREEATAFTRAATAAMVSENPNVARRMLREEVNDDGDIEGLNRSQKEAQYSQLARELGLE